MKEIVNQAEKEDRGLKTSEKSEFKKLENEVEELTSEHDDLIEQQEKEKKEILKEAGRSETMNLADRFYNKENIGEYRNKVKARARAVAGVNAEDISSGKALRGLITGNWQNAEAERRVMNTITDSSGGYTVPEAVAGDIIGKAFNQSSVLAAGATMFDMNEKSVVIPRVDGVPDAAFKEEGAAYNFGELTFSGVTLEAKSLWIGCSLTLELAEDGNNVEQAIENSLAEAISVELDRAALLADGTGDDPTGI
ncbi:MAG: phage major capsid protein, partial [Halarsenatibacteraceae bacterium]